MISVHPLVKTIKIPKPGIIVGGQVSDVQNKTAIIQISEMAERPLSSSFTGILHISDASQRYVESMFDICKLGDIVRAKVVSDKNRIFHLSIAERNLGVVYANCSECGYLLTLEENRLICHRCGKTDKKKIASDYGNGDLLEVKT